MAHYTLAFPVGIPFEGPLPSAKVEELDVKVTACIHEGGGTYAMLATCVLGGSFGITASAPCSFTDAALTCTTGKVVQINSGAELNVQSGGVLTIESGGSLVVASGGGLTLNGTTNWPTVASRTLDIWAPARLVGQETAGPTILPGFIDDVPTLYQSPRVGFLAYHLDIPQGPQGATLVSVHVFCRGKDGVAGTVTVPTYRIVNTALGAPGTAALGVVTNRSAIVTDVHPTGAGFEDWLETTIPANASVFMNKHTGRFYLRVTGAWNSADSAAVHFYAIGAKYTVTTFRP